MLPFHRPGKEQSLRGPRAVDVILVVDDNEQNRALAEGNLVAMGYEVQLAEDGPSALAMLAQEPPDLVLLDVMMPGMDGFEVCRRIRALPSGGDVPVVFATALD